MPILRSAMIGWLFVLVMTTGSTSWGQDLAELEEQAIQAAVDAVAPSVVRIETVGGLERVEGLVVPAGATTGLIVSEQGHVVSSAFNFVQQPSSILVTLPDGKRASADIVARDHSRMIVLLKVHSQSSFKVPPAVPRQDMRVGQWTLAVGRTFSADQTNVSAGVLSAANRIWGKAIQTDAKVSPSNYGGPLIDIAGRVLGVLVPMSPHHQGEIAGAEWYDSGIGFAVPLVEIYERLGQLKTGQDLYPGIMGITLQGRDLYGSVPVIATCRPNSPAAEAGLQAGDTIVELDGQAVARQAQLKHALGPKYAGDQVRVVALRGEQRLEVVVELTDKLLPYEHPFLGILPLRVATDQNPAVVVRYVYAQSPAAEAGLQQGDRIVAFQQQAVATADDLRQQLANHEPGDRVQLTLQRDGQPQTIQLTLDRLPSEVPESLPAAHPAAADEDAQRPPVGTVEIKLPEEKNECLAFVPESYRTDVAHGLVVWLHAPGGYDQQQLIEQWKDFCVQHDLILLAPKAADTAKWNVTEVDFIRKTMDDVMAHYNIDSSRIVAHGYQGGGAMSYLLAFAHRELVRGVAALDAGLPRRIVVPDNHPNEPLAVYTTVAQQSQLVAAIEAGVNKLRAEKYPVTVKQQAGAARPLNATERAELVRWIDTLDRL